MTSNLKGILIVQIYVSTVIIEKIRIVQCLQNVQLLLLYEFFTGFYLLNIIFIIFWLEIFFLDQSYYLLTTTKYFKNRK